MAAVQSANLGSSLGNGLNDLLLAGEILPGDKPSYALCKIIYTLHPIGKKMVDAPIAKAQSQARIISVPDSPEDAVRERFERVWKKLGGVGADQLAAQTMRLARMYGIGTIVAMPPKTKPNEPLDLQNLWKVADELRFNVLDPLNTAGQATAILNQDPNSPNFLKIMGINVAGTAYNSTRGLVVMNEDPIYIDYTTSAFGYVGRSVYQRSLLPLKSFIQSMITDDLVTIKAGVLIAKTKSPGTFVDNVMRRVMGQRRNYVKEAAVGNVISVGQEDHIESLDLTNIPQALTGARKNILENIAVADDMPAILLNSETFAEGFADGTEDANVVIEYINQFRKRMDPIYDWLTQIVQFIAWSPEFYKTIQARFPEEWGKIEYTDAFYRWTNSFVASWPSLKIEPESEAIRKEAVKLESLVAQVQVLMPVLDSANKLALIEYMVDNFNALKLLFPNPLEIDPVALLGFLEEQESRAEEMHSKSLESEPSPNRKFGDDQRGQRADRGIRLADAIAKLPPAPVRGKIRDRSTLQ